MEKVLAEIAEEYEDVVKAGILNIMQERELTEMFEISTAPHADFDDRRSCGYPPCPVILKKKKLSG